MSVPSERVVLKRSTGWEAYVYLGGHGLGFLLQSVVILLLLSVLLLLIGALGNLIAPFFGFEIDVLAALLRLSKFNFQGVSLPAIVLLLISWGVCQRKIIEKRQENWLKHLKQQDSLLNIILQALDTHTPVKISLKSRKVYVGIIQSEQFERVDLDNVVIIPFLSGYRDKDTLRIQFDCNYVAVYEKHGIYDNEFWPDDNNLPILASDTTPRFKDFRLVIRLDEIESISLFYPQYFDDFEFRAEPTVVMV